jgi:divalent metal cation (Fe/Co/Zn/Cd) transporter
MDKSLKIALGSLGVSLVVPAVKFTAYLNTGSLAPYSDALESIINVATSIARRRPSLRLPQGRIYVGGRHRCARQSAAMPPMLSKTHALRTRHAGKATFVDFDLVVSGI